MSSDRNRYVEGVLDTAYEAIQHVETVQYLGQELVDQVLSTIDSAVVANVRHGVVTIPLSTDPNAVPILAMRPEENLQLGKEFATLTADQRAAYERKISTWAPRDTVDIDEVVEVITDYESTPHHVMYPDSHLDAAAAIVNRFARSDQLIDLFDLQCGPTLPVVRFMLRPLVIVKMNHTGVDYTCHEMVHVDQIIKNPIRVFGSQYDINMAELGGETPAYHVGAGVRLGMDGSKAWDYPSDVSFQMAAERLRLQYNIGRRDLFAPSEQLLAAYKENGMGHILHSAAQYEAVLADLGIT